jgi:hypothetical protein
MVQRVLSVLDKVESSQDKGSVLRILSHVASSVEGTIEVGKQQGFKVPTEVQ